jgi:formate transporter
LDVANHNSVDALLPPEMAEKAERVGVEKTRLDLLVHLSAKGRTGASLRG